VNYLFMTNHGSNEHPELVVQHFDANTELNDYEVKPSPPPPPSPFIRSPIGDLASHISFFLSLSSQIPWVLRDLIADERVAHFFASDFANLRNAFPDWHPKTAILRDIKRKLQPIRRLNANPTTTSGPSPSSNPSKL